MAEFDNKNKSADGSDVISDIDVLTQKYGLSNEADAFLASLQSKYSPKITNTDRAYTPPRNNTPARTPRLFYDVNDPGSSVKIVYGNEADQPQGPEGRRIIYQENESESIAEKRRRNAQLTAKGAQGFGSQPFVKHVASSPSAIKRDDEETFTRTYKENKTAETVKTPEQQTNAPLTESKDKLVASNPETVKQQKEKRVHRHYEKTPGEKAAAFFKTFIPWKGDPAKEVVRKIVMNLSAILVLVCFGYFIDNYVQHQDKLQQQAELKDNHIETQTIDDLEAQWAAIKAKYPDVVFPEGMNIKWAELYAKNQDLIGWLKIDNTNIDTAVMHKPSDRDNGGEQDFYLRRNFYKNTDKYGTPYLEKHNTGKTLDRNNTIYGHNMMDGLSFAQLEKYYTIEGFKQSPIIKYSTLFNDYYFKVYAVFITNGYPTGDNGYLFNYNMSHFPSEANFEKFIQALDERKLYDTGVDINKKDKLLTLSTCSYEINKTDMGRLAVVGRLVREGESLTVDTSKAVANENIRYPQIWYDEHNMSNPFAGAYQWIPE